VTLTSSWISDTVNLCKNRARVAVVVSRTFCPDLSSLKEIDSEVHVFEVPDGEDGKSFGFRLEVQDLGIDSDGDPITSCTVERDHASLFAKPEPSGSQQKVALKTVKQELANSPNQKISTEDCVKAIANTLTAIQSNKRNNRARLILGTLIANGFLSSELIDDVGWVWLP
jgi:hypothetical protein